MMCVIPSLIVLSLASAAPKSSPKVLSFPLAKTAKPLNALGPGPRILDTYPKEPLANRVGYYSAELQFGSQQSTVQILVDTGSADLVVPQQKFDPSKSTSFKNLTTPFINCYGGGNCYNGYKGNDTLLFGGFEIDNARLHVATDADDGDNGIFGLSWADYDNFPFLLRNQGLIDHVAYSIWLNGESESEGELVFGGVDTTKFSGNIGLVRNFGDLTVNSDGSQSFSERPTSFTTALSALKLKDSNGEVHPIVEGLSFPVFFDTGTTTSALYRDWITALGEPLNLTWDDKIDGAVTTNVPTSGSLVFDFSGVEVELPLKDLFPRATTDSGDYSLDGKPAYWFCFTDTRELNVENALVFGESFLRFVYMVFDMDNRQFGIAQSNWGDNGDGNLLAISDTIPSATTAPNYDSVTGYHTSSTIYSLASLA